MGIRKSPCGFGQAMISMHRLRSTGVSHSHGDQTDRVAQEVKVLPTELSKSLRGNHSHMIQINGIEFVEFV